MKGKVGLLLTMFLVLFSVHRTKRSRVTRTNLLKLKRFLKSTGSITQETHTLMLLPPLLPRMVMDLLDTSVPTSHLLGMI